MKNSLMKIGLLLLVLLMATGCATTSFTPQAKYQRVSGQGQIEPRTGSDPFHVIRTEQLAPLPKGATVGIVSAAGPGTFGLFLGSALESKGLVVREMNLYALLPPGQQSLTDPQSRFTFMDTLVQETIKVISETGVAKAEDTTGNIDLDALLNRVVAVDDLTVEKQRITHYLELVASLKSMISALNVDYILVGGAPYTGLCYSVRIYDTKSLNVVFSNLVAADPTEWRKVIPVPQKDDRISYQYADTKEPVAYWELSYSEFVAGKLKIQ